MNAALILGTYLRMSNFLAECAILLQNGLIKGIVPNTPPVGWMARESRPIFLRCRNRKDTGYRNFFDCEILSGELFSRS